MNTPHRVGRPVSPTDKHREVQVTTDNDREIARVEAAQRLAQLIVHDPGHSEAVRQEARDICVSTHTVLGQLRGEGS